MKNEKINLKGKTHFDVPSSLWTPTMMLRYLEFQESYNDGWTILDEYALARFADLVDNVKQSKTFSKVYKKFHDNHWKTIRNQKLIEKHKMIELSIAE
jgi:hypothetical protein